MTIYTACRFMHRNESRLGFVTSLKAISPWKTATSDMLIPMAVLRGKYK